MSDNWFSAMLRTVALIGEEGAVMRTRSVVVFHAPDWPEAKVRALELGHAMETSYRGGLGELVEWRLEGVETLDLLGEDLKDGREVYSETITLSAGEAALFDGAISPESSVPTQSGV